MKRISVKRKNQIHENVSLLMQVGLFSSLLIVSDWYNRKQSIKQQHESRFVSPYDVKSQLKDIQRASETSNQHLFRLDHLSRKSNP
jgi:hypothetical protein